ncbi:MAG: M48 family metalloprotease [Pseudobdellovibrionaceae bacterium]
MIQQLRRVLTVLCFLALAFASHGVCAAGGGQAIIRDAEIEESIRIWTKGVIEAAGMRPEQVKIVLVQSPDVNAFVAGGSNIFIYTGLLQKTDSPAEVVGVIAHELGHISGGHLTRTSEVADNVSFEAMIGAIVGIGAAIATGDGSAAAAGISIGQGQAMNSYLAHSRVQESSADQAGFRFMTGAGLSPRGLPSFLEKLASQELLPTSQQSQYMRTHPLSRDRVDVLENKAKGSLLYNKPYPEEWNEPYQRMKAKLLGYVTPQQVMYMYKSSDAGVPSLYARAIAEYRMNHVDNALKLADQLVRREPQNPYFYELKGQMLFEFGKANAAVAPYEQAVEFLPSSGLIRVALAQALIESAGKDPAKLNLAIDHLKRAEKDEPRLTRIKRLLATAYGKMGKETEARVFLAEEALMQGRRDEASRIADATLKQLPQNSPEAIRAKDIINNVGEAGEKR